MAHTAPGRVESLYFEALDAGEGRFYLLKGKRGYVKENRGKGGEREQSMSYSGHKKWSFCETSTGGSVLFFPQGDRDEKNGAQKPVNQRSSSWQEKKGG